MAKTAPLYATLLFIFCALLFSTARAEDPGPAVTVTYASAHVAVAPIATGMRFFSNRTYILRNLPDELDGLKVTRSTGGQHHADVQLDIPAGMTIYLIIDSDNGANAQMDGVTDLHAALADSQWTRLPEQAQYGPVKRNFFLAIYKKTFPDAAHVTLHSAGFTGINVAATDVKVIGSATTAPAPNNSDVDTTGAIIFGSPGSVTRVAATRASTHILQITSQPDGPPVASVSDYSLAATVADHQGPSYFQFTTPIGPYPHLALTAALQRLSAKYASFDAERIELRLGDGASTCDDPSVALPTAVLLRSMILGFTVDPHAAIAGDIDNSEKFPPLSAVAIRFRAASAAGCKIAVVPQSCADRLLDVAIYGGPSALFSPQIIGVSTIDDAVAAARVDRPTKLSLAIDLVNQLSDHFRASPADLRSDDAIQQLSEAVDLAPSNLSAKILLAMAQHKARRRLSVAASEYYTFAAARDFLSDLAAQNDFAATQPTTRQDDQNELQLLRKVRPIADLKIQPLIDACSEFVELQTAFNDNRASTQSYFSRRQAMLNEMQTLKLAPADAQKITRAGF